MRWLAWSGAALLAGCQVLSGIASYDVDDSGRGGAGAKPLPPGFQSLCDSYCALSKDELLNCDQRACQAGICEQIVLFDYFRGCDEEAMAFATCAISYGPSAFDCDPEADVPTPHLDVCLPQQNEWFDCLGRQPFPSSVQYCEQACEGPLAAIGGVCWDSADACITKCVSETESGESCAGLWAGTAQCAAENGDAPWECALGVPKPSSGYHACIFVYRALAGCLARGSDLP